MALFSRKPKGPFIRTGYIDMHWDVEDPFLFVSHHEDDYPAGNRQQAPPLKEISGRDLGRDYQKFFGFRMYNGKVVPGFPMHAHWGYETITLAQVGYVDHFDTEGIQGRFGFGDYQWVCAPSKYQHNEMYPLANQEDRNPNDITQIFLNLPMSMKGGENAVNTVFKEEAAFVESEGSRVLVMCGKYGGHDVRSPSPVSWSHGDNHVRILRVEMAPGARFVLDPTSAEAKRNLYYVSGGGLTICDREFEQGARATMVPTEEVVVVNGDSDSVLWVLEGKPIGEKVVAFGPVFLDNLDDVRAALDEIRKDLYSEWPWDVIDKAQPLGTGRFIEYPDGIVRKP